VQSKFTCLRTDRSSCTGRADGKFSRLRINCEQRAEVLSVGKEELNRCGSL